MTDYTKKELGGRLSMKMWLILRLMAKGGYWINPPGETNRSKMYSIQEPDGGVFSKRVFAHRTTIDKLKAMGLIRTGTLDLTQKGREVGSL